MYFIYFFIHWFIKCSTLSPSRRSRDLDGPLWWSQESQDTGAMDVASRNRWSGRRKKNWTSRHWLKQRMSNAVKTPNLAGDSGRIVDFQEIYLKFIHSIINDILVLAWESFLASLVVLIHGLSQPKGGGGTEVYCFSLQGAEMIEVRSDSTMSELLEKVKLSDSTHEVAGDAQKRDVGSFLTFKWCWNADCNPTTVMTSVWLVLKVWFLFCKGCAQPG